jgi:hypothetical protein
MVYLSRFIRINRGGYGIPVFIPIHRLNVVRWRLGTSKLKTEGVHRGRVEDF